MIAIYCRGKHGHSDMCPKCRELLDYAHERLKHCPHGNHKPTCRRCIVHCYSPSHRDAIREVMRYSGPRMLFYHPITAITHLLCDK